MNKALLLIKKKFPEKKFPGVDYEKHSADVPPESIGITQVHYRQFLTYDVNQIPLIIDDGITGCF